jgi:hypothetical protein
VTGGVTEALADPDATVRHQEADLLDPGAPSRRIGSATAISRFLDVLGGHQPISSISRRRPSRVAQGTSAGSSAVHEAKLSARGHAHAV